MRNYEVIFIVHPELDETALNGVIDRVKGWITEGGGSVENVDLWGRRRMAYAIRKQHEGQYVFVHAQMKPAATANLDQSLRFLEPVMRFSIIAREN
jgi:small subunit ribosomal protein S6